MRKLLVILVVVLMSASQVYAQDLTAPPVPEHAEKFIPSDQKNFAEGLLEVLHEALLQIRPDLKEAGSVCVAIAAIMMAVSLLKTVPGAPEKTAELTGSIGIGFILLKSTGSLVNLASATIHEISEYGKLLLPVMTAAMAGQGSVSTSAALYAGTAFFDTLLTSVVSNLLMPLVYIFILLAIAYSAVREDILKHIRNAVKWVITWSLKLTLYIYTGYIGITGVVSGTTDAAALKAAKLTISGAVPVVGSILSDASEAILVSAATIKNAAGIYGLFAILAIWIKPFFQIGSHYLLLKATGGVCSTFSNKCTELVQDFSSALGLLLAMIGVNCLLLLISLVCFLKGVG